MYKITSNTLFTGNQLIYLAECYSTNDVLADLVKQSSLPEGSIIITDSQTAGRGQRGNVWEANPGKNLTLSILYKPAFVQVQFPFGLNVAVSLGIFDVLNEFIPQKVKIKWPNDMIVTANEEDKKICGILIENTIKNNQFENAIIGVGINVNQCSFLESKATSISLQLGKDIDKNDMLNKLCICIEARYLAFKSGQNLKEEYIKNLYRFNQKALYKIEDELFEGIIKDVDDYGRLMVLHTANNELKAYSFKEIGFV